MNILYACDATIRGPTNIDVNYHWACIGSKLVCSTQPPNTLVLPLPSNTGAGEGVSSTNGGHGNGGNGGNANGGDGNSGDADDDIQ
jgi:hypothetical protein